MSPRFLVYISPGSRERRFDIQFSSSFRKELEALLGKTADESFPSKMVMEFKLVSLARNTAAIAKQITAMASYHLHRPRSSYHAILRHAAHPKITDLLTPTPSYLSFPSPFQKQSRPKQASLPILRAKRRPEEEMEKQNVKAGEKGGKGELVKKSEEEVGIVAFTEKVVDAIPGPRIGSSSFPWILAVPLVYVGYSVFAAGVSAARKLSPPKGPTKDWSDDAKTVDRGTTATQNSLRYVDPNTVPSP
ncbi:hypothetical protein ACLOJK_032476 [Asimina triloba]